MKSNTLLSTVLAVSVAHAGILKRDLVVQTLDNWSSLGCYSDSQSSRTLSVAAHFGEHVSDTNCQYQCQQLGYAYAGTEYSGQCYCDNSVNTAAVQKPGSDCNMACTGDSTQPCGGSDRINLFWNGTTTAARPSTAPSTSTGAVDGFTYIGCYTDSVGARSLPNKLNTAGGASTMTVQTCVDACSAAGYSLAGAEYADECYCGNSLLNGAALASDQSTCNMGCKGDATSACGGAGRMSLYSAGGATPAQAAPAQSSTPAKVNPTLPAGWLALGCYSDQNGDKRALKGAFIQEPSGGMTIEYCTAQCKAAGFSIAGLEYSKECYCDNAIQSNQGIASDGDAQCNMACSGNAGETCGGPGRLNVYGSGPQWTQLGCYSDNINARTLAVAGAFDGSLTLEKCQASCHASGYAYAGVEYGNECHCGSAFLNGGGPASDGNAGCSFTCQGNSSELCGGANRLTMYAYINADGAISSTASTSSSGTTTTIPSTPAPQTSNLPQGWTYATCYNDAPGARILAAQQPDSSSLTASQCISTCSSAGYSIAGLEYGSQCFCGQSLQNSAAVASTGTCNMPCSGDSSKTCGAGGAMDVYYTGTLQTTAASVPQIDNLPNAFSYRGCYADSVGNRIFSTEIDQSAATASTCISYCAQAGYQVAAIEYSTQCFCGTLAQLSTSSKSDQCTMTCGGNGNYICGGPGAMTVYTSGQ